MLNKVKIPKLLSSAIACSRELVNVYETSPVIKIYETFLYLKSISTSGKIQPMAGESYHAFVCRLSETCMLSKNSMYTRIALLNTEELLKKDIHNCITLASWKTVREKLNIHKNQEFYEIKITDQTPKLEYILKTYALKENKDQQQYMFGIKSTNNRIKEAIKSVFPVVPQSSVELRELIVKMQIATFKMRSDSYDIIHSLRADDNLSLHGIRRLYGFKSTKSSTYMKRVLEKLKLITVEKRVFLSKECTRRAHSILTSELIPATYVWLKRQKMREWIMPDKITLNPCFL